MLCSGVDNIFTQKEEKEYTDKGINSLFIFVFKIIFSYLLQFFTELNIEFYAVLIQVQICEMILDVSIMHISLFIA